MRRRIASLRDALLRGRALSRALARHRAAADALDRALRDMMGDDGMSRG